MDRLLARVRILARTGAWFGGALVALAAFAISVDVILRKTINQTLGGSDEISGYVLAIGTAWALALTLLDRAHVRIDSLYTLLPVRLCALLDLLALVSFMVFAGLLTWQGWLMAMNSLGRGSASLTPLATPLAIPQFMWVAGLAFFFLVMLLLLLRASAFLVSGRVEDAHRLLGSRTALQELEEVMHEHERYKGA